MNPLQLGPFIILDYIEHEETMYAALNTPGTHKSERGRVGPEIDENKLGALHGELAEIILQLSKPSLPKIGSLSQVDDLTWEVNSRPISIPMNEIICLGSLPQSKLLTRETTFNTTKPYLERLFRKLAHENNLTKQGSPNDVPFKLWCDDFRPANALINKEYKITGVVDWEFTYAAPTEFSYAPPWWLLLEKPEYWPDGLDDWCVQYECRLETFLKSLSMREEAAICEGWLKEIERLFGPMRESWEPGDFWIAYAARCNFTFDAIYWQKIDQQFFGTIGRCDFENAWKERIIFLDEKEKTEMEEPVTRKLEEMETRVLAWEPDEYTLGHIDIKEKTSEA
ncbi:hypothetical protein N7488_003035 [Penicillium malachiteum]|nr:hypothetical protein N7488_003035 [Penicillium malachiteum]